MARASIDIAKYEQAIKPFQRVLAAYSNPSDDERFWWDGTGAQLTAGHVRDLLMVELTTIEPSSGPVPPTQGPEAKPAECSQPPPVTGFDHAFTFLRGFIQGVDPAHNTDAWNHLLQLEGIAAGPLDPRVTFSADYQLADRLGTKLEWLNAAVGALASAHLADATDPAIAAQIGDLKRELEAAISITNQLSLPF